MKQILLLDDDYYYLAKLKLAVEKTSDLSVVCFGNAEDALSAIENPENNFSVFVLDIEMASQQKSGIDVAERIRNSRSYFSRPIIFLTSHMHYSFGALKHLHYYDFFNKSCSINMICDSLIKAATFSELEPTATPKIIVSGVRYSVELNLENIACIEQFSNDLVVTNSLGEEQKMKVRSNAFADICKQLSANSSFAQIHRSIIINLHKIKKIEWYKNTATVWLFNVASPKPAGKTHLKKLNIYKE